MNLIKGKKKPANRGARQGQDLFLADWGVHSMVYGKRESAGHHPERSQRPHVETCRELEKGLPWLHKVFI